jgi:ankyrin repeat protein
MRHKVVKQLGFALIVGFSLMASPLAAQFQTPAGYDLVEAVKKRDGDKATQILASHPQGLVNTKDAQGNTSLIIAINRSDDQWAGFLLTKGADPNLPGHAGDTPLIAASRVGLETTIGWLLQMGAKVDAGNKMGETPLIIAVQQHKVPIVRMLLSAGANPDKSDSAAGYSARDYATRDPRARDILKLITDKKPKAANAN